MTLDRSFQEINLRERRLHIVRSHLAAFDVNPVFPIPLFEEAILEIEGTCGVDSKCSVEKDKLFPIDFHTLLPLVHWLPKFIHRKFLELINLNFYSKEKNLNLLCKKNLTRMCKDLRLKKFEIIEHKFFFFTSNLILIVKK
jgi:hypothetical protein